MKSTILPSLLSSSDTIIIPVENALTSFYYASFVCLILVVIIVTVFLRIHRNSNNSVTSNSNGSSENTFSSNNNNQGTTSSSTSIDVSDSSLSAASSPLYTASSSSSPTTQDQASPEFVSFQRNFLTVYLICTFSDWLKGSYVYGLYQQYDMSTKQISVLFCGGFASSLLLGTFVASLSDRFGRKNMCLLFCFVYALSALTKVVNDFYVLLLGRILSGLATSLLFSSFESWMVTQHRGRQFPDHLLQQTFTRITFLNGISAIAAGAASQLISSYHGFVAVFLAAIPGLIISAIIISSTWKENYGDSNTSISKTLTNALEILRRDSALLFLGASQSFFEASIFVFVFLWTPSLTNSEPFRKMMMKSNNNNNNIASSSGVTKVKSSYYSAISESSSTSWFREEVPPYGLIFACFMCSLMIGSSFPEMMKTSIFKVIQYIHVLAAGIFFVGYYYFQNKIIVFGTFVVFEGIAGVFYPLYGILRSRYIPESSRASVTSFIRFPMNALVVIILLCDLSPNNGLLLLSFLCCLSGFFFYKFRTQIKTAKSKTDQEDQEDEDEEYQKEGRINNNDDVGNKENINNNHHHQEEQSILINEGQKKDVDMK